MDNLTKFSVKRPLALLMAVLAVVIFGVRAYQSLNTSLMPETNIPYVTVQTIYPGAGAEVVESQLTVPLEDRLYSVAGVERVQSISMDSVSVVVLEFDLDVDPDQAVIDVNKGISEIKADLPEDAVDSVVEKIDNNATPVIEYALFSEDSEQLSAYVEDSLKPRLERLEGVGRVDVYGMDEAVVDVTLKPDAAARGVTVSLVSDALANKTYGVALPGRLPVGAIQSNGNEISVEINSELTSLADIKSTYVDPSTSAAAQAAGLTDLQPVKIGDVATVELSTKERTSYYRANRKPAVGISIVKQSGASEIEVAENVKELIGGEKPLPMSKMLLSVVGFKFEHEEYDPEIDLEGDGIEANVTADNSIFVKESVDGVIETVIEGVLLTGILLLLFLRSFRSTVIVLLAIPVSVIVTFIGMKVFGFTLNVVSLLGIAMATGILVDDSIVVIENIFQKLKTVKDPKKAAIEGRREIAGAAVAITLVDVVVFVPLAMLSGIIGQFFTEFAVTVVVATLSSLIVAFTLTPMLSSVLLTQKDEEGSKWLKWFADFIDWLKRGYGRILAAIASKGWSIALTIVVIFGVIILSVALVAPNLKQEFLVMGDSGTGSLSVEFPAGTSVTRTNEELTYIEDELAKNSDIKDFYVFVGGVGSSNTARIDMDYGPKEDREKSSDELTTEIQADVEAVAPEDAVVLESVANEGFGDSDIMYVITGPDFEKVVEISETLAEKSEESGLMKDIQLSLGEEVPGAVLRTGPRSSAIGVNSAYVYLATQGKLKPVGSGVMVADGSQVDIEVNDFFSPSSTEELAAIPLGGPLTIGVGTEVQEVSSYKSVQRDNKQRSITFTANLKGETDSGTAVSEVDEIIEDMDLDDDYTVKVDSSAMLMEEGFTELAGALLLAVVLMYMVMVALYESLITPLVVMFTVPTAVAGSLVMLYAVDAPMDLTAMVGFISLMGLVAKNGILLVDFIEHARKKGVEVKKAVVDSGMRRLRPILMTTLAIVVASVPLVLGNIPGAEFRRGIAIVYIGGLTSSLVLTLFLVPSVYLAVDGVRNFVSGLFSGGRRRTSKRKPKK